MRKLLDVETQVLIDMLAEQTKKFTRLFRNYGTPKDELDYQHCKEIIQLIILELDKRGMFSHNRTPTASNPDNAPTMTT